MRTRVQRRRELIGRWRNANRGEQLVRLPGSRKPFYRITTLVKSFNAAALEKDHPKMVIAQADIAAYRSRGHGHKLTMCRHIGGQWSLDRSRYMPTIEDRKHAHD